jgi:hypothetical protein
MSRLIATTILRIVSDFADSPYLTLSSFGAAVDQQRDLFAELVCELAEGVIGVFYRVVEQCGAERGLRHAQLGEDRCHRQRMRDELVPALAHLTGVQALGPAVRALDES